jgi:cellulose synthase (UDP-forming)
MFRIKKVTNEKYYYALGAHDARLVRLLGLLGLLSTAFIFFGYLQFLHISPLLAAFFGPVLVIILLYFITQYALMGLYPGFDLRRHKQKVFDYWNNRHQRVPRVAVFIPAAGEAVDIVRQTVLGATRIVYPNFQVFVLDDSKDGVYHQLAYELGVRYIRRQNVGHYKKAGNMNNALKQIVGFENVLVLDADFVPRPEILRELVPYAADDVGIIQSPQHFALNKATHAKSKIEYGAAYIQQDFYRVTQVARNRFGAAICVGTSALYNIEALKRVGGYEGVGHPRGWSHSEDVHTGLKMLNYYNPSDKRYKIRYVPVQLAKGACPDTHHSFYKQQNRWATGSMQLLLSGKTLFSDKLSPMQRIIYGSNSLYYFFTISMLVSPVYLLVLALDGRQSSWAFTLYFIPSLLFRVLIEPYVMRRQRAPLAISLVVISNAYTFLQALLLLIIKRPLGWEATGTKSSKKSAHFTNFKIAAATGFILLYIATFGALILNERFQFGPAIFIDGIFLTSFLANMAFLFYLLIIGRSARRLVFDRKFYAALLLCVLTVGVVYKAYVYHSNYNVVLSDSGVRFVRQKEEVHSSGTLRDGFRRSEGDVRQMLGL